MTAKPAELGASPPTLRLGTEPAATESADTPGLEVAHATHGNELFGFAYRSLRDRSLAEEAVQETFLRAWRARYRYDASKGSMRSWLFAIERYVIVDLTRARARRDAKLTHAVLDDVPGTDNQVESSIQAQLVLEAIRRLRPSHRQVLVEIHYRGRTGAELAAELAIPEGTVRSRLFYALKSLRLLLDEMGWDA